MKIIKILLTLILLCNTIAVSAKNMPNDDYKLEYVNINWWKKYNDENLVNLMMLTYKNNQDLKIASLKTKQAEQAVKESFAQELPHLGLSGNFGRELTSATTRFGGLVIPDYSQTRFLLPLTMTYEVDIWGENRLITKSYQKQKDIIKQDERASYISLTSAVASDYFNLIKLDKLIKNQEELVKLQKKIASMQKIKYENGLCSKTEVLIEQQALTVFEEELNDYKNKNDTVYNELLVLLGDRNNKAVIRNSYEKITLPEIPESITADAIGNRPDLLKTEDYIKKVGYDVKAARRAFLPKFTIYGQAGFNAYGNFHNFFGPHTFLSNIGVMPSMDLFTGGAKMAHLKFKKLEYEKASQMYEKVLLTSIQELNDNLTTAKISKKNYLSSIERHNLELDKYSLSEKKLIIGAKSNLENLKDQEEVIMSEKAEISNKINYLIATINLYKAVGGRDYLNIEENI